MTMKTKIYSTQRIPINPRECLNSFKNAVKSSGETYIQFAARLTANFQYYCSLRKVNSFESLCDLIISDKLFETLNKETATHIGIREAEDWFRPIDLAKECDIYISSRSGSRKEIPITYGYTQDPFKNKSQNFKTKIKERTIPNIMKEKIKIAIYAVIHLIAQETQARQLRLRSNKCPGVVKIAERSLTNGARASSNMNGKEITNRRESYGSNTPSPPEQAEKSQFETNSPTRGPLATDHVILNHGQVTWTTPELTPPLLTNPPHQREDVLALERFNVHRCPTRRVFSGTGRAMWPGLPHPSPDEGTWEEANDNKHRGLELKEPFNSRWNPLSANVIRLSAENGAVDREVSSHLGERDDELLWNGTRSSCIDLPAFGKLFELTINRSGAQGASSGNGNTR
ncbi:DUF1758 domain-containing protein [Trichonephila clavipes]|uniref:DUF1758 domain-containing protein n=1 Tax=Trichonephila clavipes TaxID=2585209 RepID=A0A8X6SSI3_TRICX|nr:DUF1758 domain-containing protein [Trichonephila clavipes]